MSLSVQFDRNLHCLSFEGFPGHALPYQENPPEEESCFARLQVMDQHTQQTSVAFVRKDALRAMGISLTVLERLFHDPMQVSILFRNVARITDGLRNALPIVSLHLSHEQYRFFTMFLMLVGRSKAAGSCLGVIMLMM